MRRAHVCSRGVFVHVGLLGRRIEATQTNNPRPEELIFSIVALFHVSPAASHHGVFGDFPQRSLFPSTLPTTHSHRHTGLSPMAM